MSKLKKIDTLYEKYRQKFGSEEIVLGEGNVDSEILLVGEAPGKEEVSQGKPFVGAAGKNLAEFLNVLGLKREDIYITNAIKYRLGKVNPKTGGISNRPATKNEIISSKDYLYDEIEIINPKYILTLGNVPLRSVFNNFNASIGQVHGVLTKVEIKGNEYEIFPLYHPASIIYNVALKNVYNQDLIKFTELYRSI